MSASTEELARLLPMMFRSVARLIALELDRHETGIRLSQFGVLDFLLSNSRAVQTDLANHFAKDKSVMLRQLDDMERKGWIERQQDPVDRRRKNLVVTRAGLEIHRKAGRLSTQVFERMLVGVSDKDLAACIKVIAAMNTNANSGDA